MATSSSLLKKLFMKAIGDEQVVFMCAVVGFKVLN